MSKSSKQPLLGDIRLIEGALTLPVPLDEITVFEIWDGTQWVRMTDKLYNVERT